MSAQMSRQRKRDLISALEQQVAQLQEEKNTLKGLCQRLAQENQTFRERERQRTAVATPSAETATGPQIGH